MSEPIKIKATCWSYQSMNGDNFTTAGAEFQKDNHSYYLGVGTNHQPNTTGAVFDYKQNGIIYDGNNLDVSFGCRVRTKLNPSAFSTELRPQLNVDYNNLYATAYCRGTLDYTTGEVKETYGIFAGVKAGPFRIEGQLDSKNGPSVNGGIVYTF